MRENRSMEKKLNTERKTKKEKTRKQEGITHCFCCC